MDDVYKKIIEKALDKKPKTEKDLLKIKRWASKEFKIKTSGNC